MYAHLVSRSRFIAAVSIFPLALMLVACGGGGGGSSGGGGVTPPPGITPAPTILLSSVVPAAGAAGVSVNVNPTFTFAIANVTAVNTVTSFLCGNKQVTYLATADLTSKVGSATISFAPMASLTNGDSCTMSSDVTATGAGGSAKTTVNTSFVVEAAAPVPATWWPPIFVPVGTQVIGMNQVPASAVLIGDAGWKQAVADKVQKFLDSGIILTGYNTRAIAFAFFKDQSGASCTTLVYKDDGSAVGNNKAVGNGCNTVDADWAVGTSAGVVRHFPSLGVCYQISWNQTLQKLEDLQVTCLF